MKNIKPYDNYKPSLVQWLERLPLHWQETDVRRLFFDNKIKNEGLIERNLLSLSYGQLKRKDIDNATGLVPASFEGYQIIEQGYLVLRFTDLQNDKNSLRVGFVNERGIITSAYIGIGKRRELCSKYYYYLLHFLDTIKHFYSSGGGVRQSLAFNEFGKEKVLVPTFDEQQTIAKFLDYKLGKIDRFIRKKKQLIKPLNEQKAAIINQAVTKGIKNDVKMKPSGIDWLGDIPEHWKIWKLKYLVSKIGSGVTPKGGAEVYQKSGVPFLRSQNVHFDGLHLNDVAFITPDTHSKMSSTALKPNDVLLNITGASLGRCCFIPFDFKEGNVNQHVCIIRPKNLINCVFLSSILGSRYLQTLIQFEQVGASREGLNQTEIKNLPIILPSLVEQTRIIEFIKAETANINRIISTIEKEIKLVQEYRTTLIAEAVTGKIDVSNYEIPNIEAVEKITADDEISEEIEETDI